MAASMVFSVGIRTLSSMVCSDESYDRCTAWMTESTETKSGKWSA